MPRVTRVVVLSLAALVITPAVATGVGEKAKLAVRFSPYKLGASTTVFMGFQIVGRDGGVPAPLTHISLSLPGSLGFATTLGLDTCDIGVLTEQGPGGCASDAQMGRGVSVVGVDVGPVLLKEETYVTVLMAPSTGTHTKLLIYAEGNSPVQASLIFPGEMVSKNTGEHFSTVIEADVPLVESLPEAPDVSVLSFEASIGPEGLTYYQRIRGKEVPYQPRGLSLPGACPREGFPFAVHLTFADGVATTATATIQCPWKQHPAARTGRGRRGTKRTAHRSDCKRALARCPVAGATGLRGPSDARRSERGHRP